MKKLLPIVLLFCMMLSLFVACDGTDNNNNASDTSLDGTQSSLDNSTATSFQDGVFNSAKFGELEADATMVEFYYNNFIQIVFSYYGTASSIGIDVTKPYKDQPCSLDAGNNWEDFFRRESLFEMRSEFARADVASKSSLSLTEEQLAMFDNFRTSIEGKEQELLEELHTKYSKSLTIDQYLEALERSLLASNWTDDYYSKSPVSEQDILDYYQDNKEILTDKEYKLVNIRHILVETEQEANDILAEFQKNPTEDRFAELAHEKTTDPGSKENGGLYSDVDMGQMVTEFDEWCFAEGRKIADTGIVKTDFGYHIMYMSGFGQDAWRVGVEDLIKQTRYNSEIDKLLENYPLEQQ